MKTDTGNLDTGGRLEFLCRFAGITSNNRYTETPHIAKQDDITQ